MKKYIIIICLFFSISVSAQEKVTEEERLQLENYILKIQVVNKELETMYQKTKEYSDSYQKLFDSLKVKYKKDGYDIDLQDGKFIKQKDK